MTTALATAFPEQIGGAGKGGAGLLTCLKTLGYAAGTKGWNMSYSSHYAPATRGGLVEGWLVIDENPVESPVLDSYTTVLAFDTDAYEHYGPMVQPGGLLIYDSSKIHDVHKRDDISTYGIPIFEMAERAGAAKMANMAMLGCYNKLRGLFTSDELIEGMKQYLPVWRHKLIPHNRMVLDAIGKLDFGEFRL